MKSLGLLDSHSQVDEHRGVGRGARKGSGEASVASSGLSSGIPDCTPSLKVTQ